jgi:hypothetical protein
VQSSSTTPSCHRCLRVPSSQSWFHNNIMHFVVVDPLKQPLASKSDRRPVGTLQWVAKEDVFAEDAIREFQNLNSDSRVHIRRVWTDPESYSPFRECTLPGLSHEPSPKTCSTSIPANLNITSNSASSATSHTNTAESTCFCRIKSCVYHNYY